MRSRKTSICYSHRRPPEPKEAAAGFQERGLDRQTEPLVDGKIDLGALAIEFLILGLDPYPRKPGAIFQPPADAQPDEGPFAALGVLKKGHDGA